MAKQKIIIGLSGGVDSSVSALLLQQQGYDVEALFMKNWEGDDTDIDCPAETDLKDAKAVADKLGIKLHVVNFAADYWDRVFEHFLNEYNAGRTPNPDILCNKEIKFKAFLDYALKLGADKIATGHYARIHEDEQGFHLLKGLDSNKDQSYFLCLLNQEQLSKAIFPIGELEKTKVREIAQEQGFITANKKDSTGICFIGEKKFKSFLQEYLPAKPGNIETLEGDVIGSHDGLMYHTIGQRKGLMIGGLKDHDEDAWYVVEKNLERNTLLVAQGTKHSALYKSALTATQAHWINAQPDFPLECKAKTRYRQADQPCIVHLEDKRLYIEFHEPQRAITPGQAVVFYKENECIGSGIIEH